MPGTPRKEVFGPTTVGVYHCFNRCTKRAFFCGIDPLTKQDFSHRKSWIRDKLKQLAGAMAVDILDYAVLDNHLHVVLRNRPDLVEIWSDEEVVRRWWMVCPERRDEQGNPAEISELELNMKLADSDQVNEFRSRLSDISWFMRQLCQPIARRANEESKVTGLFLLIVPAANGFSMWRDCWLAVCTWISIWFERDWPTHLRSPSSHPH